MSFHNDCCIAVFLQGFLAPPGRQGDAGSAAGRCIRQHSRVHSRALLLIPADCSHQRTALECKPALKHRLGHLANVMANGCAGTDPFWQDTKESGRAPGGRSNQLRSANPHSDISEQSTGSSAQTHWKLHRGSAENFCEDRAGLLRALCQQALTVIASVGDRKHAVNFWGFPETRSFLLAFCPPPRYWVIMTPLEQVLSLHMGVNTVA